MDTCGFSQLPHPRRTSMEQKMQKTTTSDSYGSPPATERAQSSSIELSDEDVNCLNFPGRRHSDGHIEVGSASVSAGVQGGSVVLRRGRGRPPTTGEWIGITDVLERYNAARAVKLELDETEFILNPNTRPKQNRAKVKSLPGVEELRMDLRDLAPSFIGRKAGESFLFLDKLSDKAKGLNRRLAHELRLAARRVEACVAELCDRVSRQDKDFLHIKRVNEYLKVENNRLTGELNMTRVECESLRASVSPLSRSPPYKRARGIDNTRTREFGTQMEIGGVASPDPGNVPLPASPLVKRDVVDRGCSPICAGELAAVSRFLGETGGSGTGVSPLGSRDITALEQSLLDHIEALFAQRSSLQEDIVRIRKDMDDPRRGSISSAVEAGRLDPKTPARKRKKKRKVRKGERQVSPEIDYHQSPLVTGSDRVIHSGSTTSAHKVAQWSQVIGRKARRLARSELGSKVGPPSLAPSGDGRDKGRDDRRVALDRKVSQRTGQDARFCDDGGKIKLRSGPRPRTPTTAVVSVTLKPGAKLGYREVMFEARSKIDLKALGIVNSRIRQAVNGGVLIQIPGKDRVRMADDLANCMGKVLKGRDVWIGWPSKCAELRIRGVDISVTSEDVISEVARLGGCRREDIRMGRIRETSVGLGTVWLKCPAVSARRVVDVGYIRVGWGRSTVEPLRPRLLVCFRCLRQGHVKTKCKSVIDRGDCCYRCGAAGHRVASCVAAPRCPLCVDLGRPSDHVWGGRG
ncbi:unnamed protein product [Lasius platythorax]|uniref:CCHC-type domain-containing protein n=1 Tax=Lasius platythorax TaxID=488582 RepID=A0AAV2MZD0_9HYME